MPRSQRGVRLASPTVLIGLLPVSILAAGCGAPRSQEPPVASGSVSVVYQSRGAVNGLDTVDGALAGEVLVWESRGPHMSVQRPWQTGQGRELRRLNVLNGAAKVVHEEVEGDSEHWLLDVSLSPDGSRMGASYTDSPALQESYGLCVSSDGRSWRTVNGPDECLRVLPRFSPDGGAIAFLKSDLGNGKLPVSEAVVVRLGMGSGPEEETVLTRPGGAPADVVWAGDGRRLYQVVHRRERGDYMVEAVDWPSLERQIVMTGGGMGMLSVAGKTGAVVWLEQCGVETPDDQGEMPPQPVGRLWRLSPEGGLEQTPVTVKGVPVMAVVSPDGRRLAVVTGDPNVRFRTAGNGLVVHSLADGAAHVHPEFDQKSITDVAWVLEGQALVVAEGKKNVWLVGM